MSPTAIIIDDSRPVPRGVTKTIPTNEYGNVDIRNGIPKGLAHIPYATYCPLKINMLCRKAKCPTAPAFIGFTRSTGRYFPETDGIVVPIHRRRRIMTLIENGHKRLAARKSAKPRDYTAGFAREYGSARNALLPAAHAMFDLNRYAKHQEYRDVTRYRIYLQKGRFIYLLHRMGLCESVQEHHQLREAKVCYRCEGSGCQRCDWTGLYKPEETVVYYAFTFRVEGTRFCWHQPEEEVDFPVTISGSASPMPEIGVKPLTQWTSRIAKAQALVQWVIDGLQAAAGNDQLTTREVAISHAPLAGVPDTKGDVAMPIEQKAVVT